MAALEVEPMEDGVKPLHVLPALAVAVPVRERVGDRREELAAGTLAAGSDMIPALRGAVTNGRGVRSLAVDIHQLWRRNA